jgi:hypothetical protein
MSTSKRDKDYPEKGMCRSHRKEGPHTRLDLTLDQQYQAAMLHMEMMAVQGHGQ